MRFYTIQMNGEYLPAISTDGGKTAFTFEALGVQDADVASFVRQDAFAKAEVVAAAIAQADPALAIDLQAVRICAPIMHPDQDMVCLGINYSEHAKESASFDKDAFGGERPYTIYFSKRVNYASGDGDPIPSYTGLVEGLDYEVELGVVLGRDVLNVSVDEASDAIFGYTVVNDVSARNLQTRHKQWYLGKSLDGFTPMGPCIVTPDELGDVSNLQISCSVNGEARQNSSTSCMIQTISGAIAELCEGMTLKAGTIIATGTPAGVGMGFNPPRFLNVGDICTCSIEGIGQISNQVVL